ncbi:hypothetical protein EDD36DRAFT_498208 [Exophiala viscosa]|uniref:Uncharacterized protein n=1 Tax=Exophiala viscosa TaxID=2486360 RepID=A0AAN6IA53_9EURO|nr:hypothetical protein EDD36DRAFT_498208 [Exophiala viscosa]
MSRTVVVTVRQALQVAQNSESGQIDPRILQILENALSHIWENIQKQPNSYVMTVLEFAIFNFYRARSELQNEIARKAVSRYWNNRNGDWFWEFKSGQ